MKKPRYIIVRVPVTEASLDAMANRYGKKRGTERDLRDWAGSTIDATMEQLISEAEDARERKSPNTERSGGTSDAAIC